jgi:hypothetical protein
MRLHDPAAAAAAARIVILVNTRNNTSTVAVEGAGGGSVRAVDLDAGFETTPYSERKLTSSTVELGGWGVAIVTLP